VAQERGRFGADEDVSWCHTVQDSAPQRWAGYGRRAAMTTKFGTCCAAGPVRDSWPGGTVGSVMLGQDGTRLARPADDRAPADLAADDQDTAAGGAN